MGNVIVFHFIFISFVYMPQIHYKVIGPRMKTIVSAPNIPHNFVLPMYCDMNAKVGKVEPVETVVVKQRYDKHVSAALDTDAAVGNAVFLVQPVVAKAL
jgi:RecG-like helicase